MRLLIYVDDSPHARQWLPLLRRLVRASETEVTLFSTAWSTEKRLRAFDEAIDLLDVPARKVERRESPGLVENALPDAVREGGHDLAIIGRLGSLDWLTNGLIANLVVRRTPSSVLVLRGKPKPITRILACTAGPQHGVATVGAAIRMARDFQAEVTILHVLSQYPLEMRHVEYDEFIAHFLESDTPEARHLADSRAALAAAGVEGDVRVRVGLVVEEIVAELTEGAYGLVVFGAHEAGGSETLFFRDVSEVIARQSPTSLLVVRGAPSWAELPGGARHDASRHP